MYRFFNKAIDYIGRKSPILVHTPRADTLGNCAEEIFFGLLKAKREGKKIIFLYPQSLVFGKHFANHKLIDIYSTNVIPVRYVRLTVRWLLRNLVFRRFTVNQQIFNLQSPYCVQNRYASFIGGWLLNLEIVLMWLGYRAPLRGLRRIRRWIWPRDSARMVFNFAAMTPIIGSSSLWKPNGVNYFFWEIIGSLDWRRQYEEYVPPKMIEHSRRFSEEMRVQMGIPLSDWFVCLHVRESGFRNNTDKRDSSIENYVEGVRIITDAGGWVVRIGDPSMTPLPQMERVVDYPHTRFKTELMDIYLISHCRFFIGTNSGPSDVATLFKKPMLLVNMTEWTVAFPLNKGDIAIIKHIYSRSRNRFLSMKEILDEPFDWQDFGGGLDEYLMVENTSYEIRQVIGEFLSGPKNFEYSELQKKFNKRRNKQIHRWFDHPNPFGRGAPEDEHSRMYRVASRWNSAAGTLGQQYLEGNWLADSLENVP